MTKAGFSKTQILSRKVLNEIGFSHLKSVLPPQNICILRENLHNIFMHIKQTKFAETQQGFWQEVPSKEVKTLRLPNVDKVLEENQNFISIAETTTNLVQNIFDPHLHLRGVHSFFKPAKVGGETPWHQDPAYGDKSIIHDNVTCWIPLQNISSASESCLEFVPGSHVNKELRYHLPLSKERLSALVANISDDEALYRVAVPCKLGDIVVHKSYVVHRGTSNLSDKDRIAIVFIYGKNE